MEGFPLAVEAVRGMGSRGLRDSDPLLSRRACAVATVVDTYSSPIDDEKDI